MQARRKHFEIGGAQYPYPFLGPYRPKYWGGPTICFTLFSPNIGGARAPPAHTLPPGLQQFLSLTWLSRYCKKHNNFNFFYKIRNFQELPIFRFFAITSIIIEPGKPTIRQINRLNLRNLTPRWPEELSRPEVGEKRPGTSRKFKASPSMQSSYCIRISIPPFKVVSALPTEHSLSFQAWSSLPKYRWIASVPQIQMRGLCTITK